MRSGFDLGKNKPCEDVRTQVEQVNGLIKFCLLLTIAYISPSASHLSIMVADNIFQTSPRERPSLALNFDVSSPNKPMFDDDRNASASSRSSWTQVHRSSPITVPSSSKENTPPCQTTFEVGTVPDSPAPISKASVQQSILSHTLQDTQELAASPLKVDPNPTPMPGTNLPLEEIQTPDIVVSSPGGTSRDQDDYFAIPMTKANPIERTVPVLVRSVLVESSNGQQKAIFDASTPPVSDVIPSKRASDDPFKDPSIDGDDDPFAHDPEGRKSFEGKADYVSAYLAQEGGQGKENKPYGLERRQSKWGRHSGLYDGTGYAASDFDENPTSETAPREASQGNSETTASISDSSINLNSADSPIVEPPVDEKETLQEIIRAYAFPIETDEGGMEVEPDENGIAKKLYQKTSVAGLYYNVGREQHEQNAKETSESVRAEEKIAENIAKYATAHEKIANKVAQPLRAEGYHYD